ncbi:hypothetical protein B0T20DRAFT_111736 [Sordaria brevicollis]|uniref:Uncharacterized protein n=1 Tax=Sordaria brevicollis TaxID=83679 RepID=A0AAE0U0I7_SORBR|nr:hypothetical protein B0T20DRAFT_111736 [Sordaria brevicollis]
MERLRLPSNEFFPSSRASSRDLEDMEYEYYARTIRTSRRQQPLFIDAQPVSPAKAHWVGVLNIARDKLEEKTGEIVSRVLPQQPDIHLSPWNAGIKKKGKTDRGNHYMLYTVTSLPLSDKQQKLQAHSNLLKFNRPVKCESRDSMKRDTTKKHRKLTKYPYEPLPPNFDIYKNYNYRSVHKRRQIACHHRFHQSEELETIPEHKEMRFKKFRLPRVELMDEVKRRQGPRVVVPAPFPATNSTWAMMVGINKPLPALPNATATSTQTKADSGKKVLVLKPAAYKKKTTDARFTIGPATASAPTPSTASSSSTTNNFPQYVTPFTTSITAQIPERPVGRAMAKSYAQVVSGDQVQDASHKKQAAKWHEEESAAKWRAESGPAWKSNFAQRREEAAEVDRRLVEAGIKTLPDLRPNMMAPTQNAAPSSSSTKVSSYKESHTPMTNTPSQSSTTVAPTKRSANSPPNEVSPKKKMRMAKDTSSAVEVPASSSSASSSSSSTVSTTTPFTNKRSWREVVGITRKEWAAGGR